MDWHNEPYVRVYTRDTTNFRRIGWDGQCVLLQLLRKVDRAGVLDLEGLEPWEAVALHTGAPEDVAKRGVAELLRVETLVIRGSRLVFPNHQIAQEAQKSDRLRAKESRERRSAVVTNRDDAITERDLVIANRDETSQPVTPGHTPSHAVTPRHSLLCSAVLCSADLDNALQGGAGGNVTPAASPAARAAPPTASATSAKRKETPGAPAQPPESRPWSAQRADVMFRVAFMAAYDTDPTMAGRHIDGFWLRVANTAKAQSREPEALYAEALGKWLLQPRSDVDKRAPYACFVQAWGALTMPPDGPHGGPALQPNGAVAHEY